MNSTDGMDTAAQGRDSKEPAARLKLDDTDRAVISLNSIAMHFSGEVFNALTQLKCASASDIADVLDLPVEIIECTLFHLQKNGIVVPVIAYRPMFDDEDDDEAERGADGKRPTDDLEDGPRFEPGHYA